MAGPYLWIDELVVLDAAADAVGGSNQWTLPPEKYLEMSRALGVHFTIQYEGIGPGAASTTLTITQSNMVTDGDSQTVDVDPFETLAVQAITRARGVAHKFAVQSSATPPSGLGRIKLVNAGTAGQWSITRVRIWVTTKEVA